uniref:Uncharacterized protein n=1 Tax=Arundo donax TaxID=35708 RepID=A0A0A8YIF0_ARUDO
MFGDSPSLLQMSLGEVDNKFLYLRNCNSRTSACVP